MEETTTGHGLPDFTAAAAYPGYKPPEAHTLPSGAVFWLRKPPIRKLMQRGQIPNPLMDVINSVFQERDQAELTAEAEAKGMTEAELLEQRQIEAEAAAEDPTKPPPIPRLEDEITPEIAYSFGDVIAWASIVKPVVETEPPVNGPLTASGALSYQAIDDDDIQYILRFANGEFVNVVAPFPSDVERQDPGVDGGTVRDEAEPVVGHPA